MKKAVAKQQYAEYCKRMAEYDEDVWPFSFEEWKMWMKQYHVMHGHYPWEEKP